MHLNGHILVADLAKPLVRLYFGQMDCPAGSAAQLHTPITLTLSLEELQFLSLVVHQHNAANCTLRGAILSLETMQRCHDVLEVIDPLIKKAARDLALRRIIDSQFHHSSQ
jgi:hypothetical protein